ncbi:MAG: TIGR03087 family PEP-CTERM/XrtA system glycosyltransferase [Deferrisomatales bacterium]
MAESGWRVHLCALADDEADLAHLPALEQFCATVFVEPISPLGQKLRSLPAPFMGRPLSAPYFYSARLQQKVDAILSSRAIDAILCFSGPMAEYVFRSATAARSEGARRPVAQRSGSPTRPRLVMDLVDVDSDKWSQYARFQRWPLSWVYRLEGALLARYERRVAERFDAVALVSPAEAELFGRRCGLPHKVHAVGNGVDLEYFHPTPEPCRPHSLVFCGAMDYFPNADAVVWFAREVLPRVRQAVGEVTFTIVGSKPTPEVRALAAIPEVRVTGRVDDVRPYVWEAAVSVAPIRIARGVQNKVLEAMAMARPVVATPAAFEGIKAEPGRDLLVAEASAFAEGVGRLLLDPRAAQAMGQRGRSAVEAGYGWGAQLVGLDSLCRASSPLAALTG